MLRIQSLAGLFILAMLAWMISENRKKIKYSTIASGLIIQVLLALVLVKLPFSRSIFTWLNNIVSALQESTAEGAGFVFGYLGGGSAPFAVTNPGSSFILAFQSLPLVLLISALSALLFYWKIIPLIVRGFSWLLSRGMGVVGVEGLGVSANIFVGMVEAPLLVKPYIPGISRSELFTIMTSGMATIAGTVMVLYASILNDIVPGITGHLLTASLISAPAAITVSKLMIPETASISGGDIDLPDQAGSSMDAVTKGTFEGINLLINIAAMLVVLVALVHLLNMILGIIPDPGGEPITIQRLLGYIMAPVTWIMGIPWSEAKITGSLMGIKTILNELIAYQNLASLGENVISERSRIIMTYAMCGFANPGSLGIIIGGMGAMAPERRNEIVSLGMRSIVAGTIATCMTGAVMGIIY
ncbi:MAG: nucleoside transporter C-terminal domain-containing protein [Desulfobacteraceae bacterium]